MLLLYGVVAGARKIYWKDGKGRVYHMSVRSAIEDVVVREMIDLVVHGI